MTIKEYKPEKPESSRLSDSQSLKASECPKCHEVFSSVSMFDKHLKRVSDKTDTYRMICQYPGSVGLSMNSKNYWTIPQDDTEPWWK